MQTPEYQDLVQRLAALDLQMKHMERTIRTPFWKKALYGLTLAFLTASTAKYWIDKVDRQPPAYVLPCVSTGREAGLEEYYAK